MTNEHEQAKNIRDEVTKRLSQQQFDEGLKLLESNAATLPEHVRLECMGTHHFYRKDFQAAIRLYEEAIVLAPDYLIARYQYLVGIKNERQGNFVDAFKRYQASIEIEPTFVDAYVDLGGLLTKVEDFVGAAQCYRDAAKLDPHDVVNLYNLKAVLESLTKTDPQRYQTELQNIESTFLRLQAADGSTPPPARAW